MTVILKPWFDSFAKLDGTTSIPMKDGDSVNVGQIIEGNVFAHIGKGYAPGTHVSLMLEEPDGNSWCDDIPDSEPKRTPPPVKADMDYNYLRFYRTPGVVGDYEFTARICDTGDNVLAEQSIIIHAVQALGVADPADADVAEMHLRSTALTQSKAWFANFRTSDGAQIVNGSVVPVGTTVEAEAWAFVDPVDQGKGTHVTRIVNEPGKGRWNTRCPQFEPRGMPSAVVFGHNYHYSDLMQVCAIPGPYTFQVTVDSNSDAQLGTGQLIQFTAQ